jgi:hypothetical protein
LRRRWIPSSSNRVIGILIRVSLISIRVLGLIRIIHHGMRETMLNLGCAIALTDRKVLNIGNAENNVVVNFIRRRNRVLGSSIFCPKRAN